MKISQFCIERPVFAIVINLLIVLAGIVAYRALTVREFPNITTPIVNIETAYAGASAEIIETEITKPLEDALSGIEGIDYISSTSRDEASEVTIVFKPERNLDAAVNDVRDSVGRAKEVLPKEAKEPIISKMQADANAIIWLAFSSDQYSLMELSEYADTYVKEKLELLPGVASIQVAGERQPAMRIWIDPLRLAAYSLTIQDVAQALRQQNVAIPSGRVESQNVEFVVYTKTDLQTPEEFKNIILRSDKGYLLRLGEVANIELGPKDERFLARYNGNPTLGYGLIKQSTANPLDIAKAVKQVLPSIQASLPVGMKLEIAFDSTTAIKESIRSVYKAIVEAIILVVLIIFLFLRSLRATFIPIVTIPIALIGGFALMLAWGFSINILTLLAMVLAIGLVVDDAIVVLENIYRHIEEGLPPLQAAKQGMQEIAPAIIAMTLTLVSVFSPVAFTEGKIGKLFTEFAVVLAGTVVISGFTALTLSPMMCARLLKPQQAQSRFSKAIGHGLDKLNVVYRDLLIRCLQWRRLVLVALVVILGINLLLFNLLRSETTPQEDQGYIMTAGMAPEGATIEYSTHYALELEKIIAQNKEIQNDFLIVGWPNVQQVYAFTSLLPWDKRRNSQQEIVDNLNEQLYPISGLLTYAINPSSSIEQDEFGGQIALVVQRPGNYLELEAFAEKVLAKARDYPGFLNLDSDLKLNKPQIDILVDREKVAQSGTDIATIGETLKILFAGQDITRFKHGNKKYDVVVKADKNLRQSPADLANVLVRAHDGSMLPLMNLIQPVETTAATALNHFNKLPAITFTASLAPRYTIGETLAYLENVVKEVGDNTIIMDYKNASRIYKQTGKALYITFILALLVVFLVLAAQFESFKNPFVIMFSVPLGIAGALLTLNLVGGTLNVFSQIGLITLIGLITKHGILLVEFANQLQREGKKLDEAIVTAATLRLRPILMTTAAMVLGAIPLAFATGAGAEGRQQIGWAIVGGMAIGTVLTLFIVPVMYRLICNVGHHR